MPEFIRILNKESWVFVISRCALALVLGLLSWPVTIWLVDLYDLYSPILEADSLRWLILASSISILFFAILVVRACVRKPNPSEIAEEVEKGNPQLRDLLNCAVEINQKSKTENLSYMEKRVLEATAKEIHSIALAKGTRPGSLYWISVLLGIGVGAGLAVWGSGKSPVQKAFDSLSDEAGLTLSTNLTGSINGEEGPPSHEFTRGSDVSIFADVLRGHRGQKQATIEYVNGDQVESVEMLETRVLGRFEFVVPALKDTFEYRVVTPSLASKWL